MREHTSHTSLAWLAAGAVALLTSDAAAMTFSGYTAAKNDRFLSGHGTNPIPNPSASFIGASYDLSGLAWASQDAVKSFVLLSPQHYLTTMHWGGASNVSILGRSGAIETRTQARTTATGVGYFLTSRDLGIGTLTSPFSSSEVARYAVLDLYTSSTTSGSDYWNYMDRPLLSYGRGTLTPFGSPRLAETTVGYTPDIHTLRTETAKTKLEAYDSGGALFGKWTNPAGVEEITVMGNHSATSFWENIHNSVVSMEAMNALNRTMTPDGFALRIVGDSAAKWTGSGSLSDSANWNTGATPTDRFVGLDAGLATSASATVDTPVLVRGLNVTDLQAAGQHFAINGEAELSIGRGGVANLSPNRLTIGADVRLADHQYWSTGAGGVTLANLDTNGKLVEFAGGAAANRITGNLTGTGSVAVNGGELELSGNATHEGTTWVHDGTLRVTGTVSGGAGVKLASTGVLTGTGSVNAVQGSGLVSPGASPGILTATQVNPTGGLDFAFEFTTKGLPDFSNPGASLNDVLRITGASAFSAPLTLENEIWIFLNVPTLRHGDHFVGGFFLDQDPNLFSSIAGATVVVYLANANGDTSFGGQSYALYAGPESLRIEVRAVAAAFTTGSVTGVSMEIVAMPEPRLATALVAFAAVGLVYVRRRIRLRAGE